MRYSEQFMEHIEYAFHAFCKIVLRHEAMNAWRDLKRKEEREISRECPNAQLKKIRKGKGDRRAWMSGTIAVLLKPEAVIGPYENS